VKILFEKNKTHDELQELCSKVSLIDPLTRGLIQVPARATTCQHLQCFELQSYILFNEKSAKWNCPCCYKIALYENLIVDEYFKKILTTVPKDTQEVEIHPNGSWNIPSKATNRKGKLPNQ
jgi:hypothetical protein